MTTPHMAIYGFMIYMDLVLKDMALAYPKDLPGYTMPWNIKSYAWQLTMSCTAGFALGYR